MKLNVQKRKPALLLFSMAALLLTVTTAGYGSGRNQSGTENRVTLEFLAPSPTSQVTDFEEVWNEVYKQTDSTLNIRVNYVFTGFEDIGQKVSLRIASGEQLDGAFVAQWTNPTMQQMASQGLLTNLDKYFNNDAYPGLKKYFSPDYLKGNVLLDSGGESHTFAVPFVGSYAGADGIYYRKDLAAKYGIGEINSYETLLRYFDAILANEPGMIPYGTLGQDGISDLLLRLRRAAPQTSNHNTLTIAGSGGVFVAIGDDGTAYASRHFLPAMDPKYQSMVKGPFKDEDPLLGYRLAREWYEKGYLEKDILNQKDHEGLFVAGRAAAFPRSADTYAAINTRLKSSIPNAELGFFIYSENIRFNTVKANGTNFQVWNFLAVPSTSKNADRVMGLMNWIFEDTAHHDLLEYGIPGKHWIPVGTDKYDYPAGLDPSKYYNFSSYVLTWNPLLIRYAANMPDFVVSALKKGADANSYYKQADAGFSFNLEPVATEIAKIADVTGYKGALQCGVPSDTVAEVARVQRLYEEAGFAKVAAEVERQFNEFLKKNPYEGQ
jgi:putative aldouronate transport system substrate-binding protein